MTYLVINLTNRTVTLLYHKKDPKRVEVFLSERSYGFLLPLNAAINSRIRRTVRQRPVLITGPPSQDQSHYRGGSLFDGEEESQ